MYVETLFSN